MVKGTSEMLGLPALFARLAAPISRAWHALRHSFASHYIMQAATSWHYRRFGHSDIKMTMIYAHLAPDFLGGDESTQVLAVVPKLAGFSGATAALIELAGSR